MRAVGFLISALLAVFLGALVFLVLDASYTGSPAGAWLFRGFYALVVGGIAVGLLVFAYGEWRSPTTPGERVPPALAALCPSCGHQDTAAIRVCPSCGFVVSLHAEAWTLEDQGGRGGILFIAVLGLGLACLGIGVGIGPYLEGEDRIGANVAFGALGLLILAVGGVMVWGSILSLRAYWRGEKVLLFSAYEESAELARTITAQAQLVRGVVVTASGRVHTDEARPVAQHAGAVVERHRESLVRALVTLHRERRLQVLRATDADWGRAGTAPRETSVVRTVGVRLTPERPDEGALRLIEALRLPVGPVVALDELCGTADGSALTAWSEMRAWTEDAEDARVAAMLREALDSN